MTTDPAHTHPHCDRGRLALIGQVLRGTAAGLARALTTWLLEHLSR